MRRVFAALAAFATIAAAASDEAARYYLVFLRPDPSRKPIAKEESDRIMAAHMANIRKMAADGVMIAAGPFEDKPVTISGAFFFRLPSLEAAQKLAAADPTVVEHRNLVETHAWMGPAGIGDEYFKLHKQDPATPENMQPHPLFLMYRGRAWQEKGGAADGWLARHGAYISELRQKGKLGAAGSVEGEGDLVGVVIFKAIPGEEAEALLKDDPAVREGVLRLEPHRWWSADHVLPW
jgi:uncharacterized protein YciI